MDKDKYKTPHGTIAILVLYVFFIFLLWGAAYMTMLAQGVTR
ncbi:MAG: hypothetical protein AB1791_15320 [Chloroflexota bacterium]